MCRGTVEDTELVDGLIFNQKAAGTGGPNRVEKAKIGLIQFCISPPKTDVSVSPAASLSRRGLGQTLAITIMLF